MRHRVRAAASVGITYVTSPRFVRHRCRQRPNPVAAGISPSFNLSQIVRRTLQSAYLGYAVGKPFAGQGYMRDGIDLVLRRAFVTLRLHRAEANIQPGNRASIALAQGAGFNREGFSPRYLKIADRWRDHERWAILRRTG